MFPIATKICQSPVTGLRVCNWRSQDPQTGGTQRVGSGEGGPSPARQESREGEIFRFFYVNIVRFAAF